VPDHPNPPRDPGSGPGSRDPGSVWPHYQRTLGSHRDALRPRGAESQARSDGGSPANRREAIADDEKGWMTAEGGEIDNHASKNSWSYHPRSSLPRGRRLVKLTWAYKVKRSLVKKAGLHADPWRRLSPVHQTFCAAMRVASLRTLVGVIAPVIPKYTITAITAFLLSRKPVIPRVIANEGEE
jgi:hypothetical protein